MQTDFAQRLANARPRSLSQEQVAALLDISRSALSLWERGERVPPADDLARLLALYKVSDEVRLSILAAAGQA